jgi:hypothetical protein
MFSVVLAAAALSCGSPATADAKRCEQALREGEIVSSREVGQGVSGALRIGIRFEGAEVSGIFKSITSEVKGYTFHKEKAPRYRDSWKHEVAAYELDRLLNLRLVPATVEREIKGTRGSLQAWTDRPLTRFGEGPLPPDSRLADNYLHAQRFFDYLIFNTDRHIRNVMFGSDWRPVAIDQSITFHGLKRPYRPLYRFPRGPIEALERLDERALQEKLGRYLAKDEIKGLVQRRARIIELVKAAKAEGRPEALFEW